MPELRENDPARGMVGIDHRAPAFERGLAVHVRGIVAIDPAAAERGGVVDADALGDDQSGIGAACIIGRDIGAGDRSEEHTSELQSLMRISYAVFCLKKKKEYNQSITTTQNIYTTQ